MPLIGLDVGTTGCKANLFDRTGRILGRGAREAGEEGKVVPFVKTTK